MRQLFTLRLIATLGALGLLLVAVNPVASIITGLSDDGESDRAEAAIVAEPIPRKIDLIAPVLLARDSGNFELDADGRTTGFVDLTLDDRRIMRVAPGTLGEVACDRLNEVDKCAVFADLLGDAVVWFAVLPQAPRRTVELPPVLDLRDGYAVFENGWRIAYPPKIERDCDPELDIVSFSDFLRRFGPGSTSIVDIETQQVTEVRCGERDDTESGSTTTTTLAEPDVVFLDTPDSVPGG